MAKRLITLAVTLLALGLGAAGCGDDGPDDSGDTAGQVTDIVTEEATATDDAVASKTETEAPTLTEPLDGATTSDGDGDATAPQDPKDALADCLQASTSYPQLSADTKADLEALCRESASGDTEGAREAGRAVCRRLVDEVYPRGVPGKAKAREACQSSVK